MRQLFSIDGITHRREEILNQHPPHQLLSIPVLGVSARPVTIADEHLYHDLLPGSARLEAHAIAFEAPLKLGIEPCGHRAMVSLVARLIPVTSAGTAGPLLVINPPADGVDLQVRISGLSL